MNHLLILPVLIPLFMGATLLVAHRMGKPAKRVLSLLATFALVPVALCLLLQASDDQLRIYALGNWQPPFGIILLLDRLSALLLLLTSVLASLALIYGARGDDERGPNFHSIFQFQLLGINGAFLTGDLFNLFVFFEILLISSYVLLVHGNGGARIKAGMHYVVLNLLGSSFFLIGVGILYGLTGTLNMADLAVKVGQADAETAPLIAAAAYFLLVVFALKAAILPLYFWLPRAYAAATAPVAALFAIMTKVGLYAIIRVFTLIFGGAANELAYLAHDLLWWLAALTIVAGVIGALAARQLQVLLAYLVVVSVGTLLAGFALGNSESLAAALYYLVHSTLVAGGLFLLADLISRQRGEAQGELLKPGAVQQPLLLGGLFFVGCISVAGLPPFSGFLGKVMLLRAVLDQGQALLLWPILLVGGLGLLIALSRAGSALFWAGQHVPGVAQKADPARLLATVGLLSGSIVLVIAAQPISAYMQATAEQLLNLQPYLAIVRGGEA